MAYKTFVVERTEDESTQTAGAATLNRADVPPLVKVFDDESDIVLSTLSTNEIVATKNTDYSAVAVVDRVAEGNLNPVTSNAVAGALSYSTDETPTGGKWIDGKPIYRKVVEKTLSGDNLPSTSDWTNLLTNQTWASDVRFLLSSDICGFFGASETRPRTATIYCRITGTTVDYYSEDTLTFNDRKCYLIFEYTKTTD